MERFAKIGWKRLTIFTKLSVLDVWQGCECSSGWLETSHKFDISLVSFKNYMPQKLRSKYSMHQTQKKWFKKIWRDLCVSFSEWNWFENGSELINIGESAFIQIVHMSL